MSLSRVLSASLSACGTDIRLLNLSTNGLPAQLLGELWGLLVQKPQGLHPRVVEHQVTHWMILTRKNAASAHSTCTGPGFLDKWTA